MIKNMQVFKCSDWVSVQHQHRDENNFSLRSFYSADLLSAI